MSVKQHYRARVLVPEYEWQGDNLEAVSLEQSGGPPVRRVYPLDEDPALFRNFAYMEPTKDNFLAFVNKYGASVMGEDPPHFLVPLSWLLNEQRQLREAIEALDAAEGEEGRREVLQECLSNVHLGLDLQLDEAGGRATVVQVTESLHDAMWLQLAMSIVDDQQYRRCKHCGRSFLVTPEVSRSDKQFCSHSCRLKFYRRKKKRAAQLRKSGASLRKIAKDLDTDMQTLKGWLGE